MRIEETEAHRDKANNLLYCFTEKSQGLLFLGVATSTVFHQGVFLFALEKT